MSNWTRQRAADHSARARDCAEKLQKSVNDNYDSGSLETIYRIMDAHETNEEDQNDKAHRNSNRAQKHRHNSELDFFGDRSERRHARKKAKRSIKSANMGRKAAEKSYRHTDTAIGFLKLGHQHVDQMRMLGHKDPNYHAHHQGFQNCVDNAAMPEPSRRKLNKARKSFEGMSNVGVLGWDSE